MACPTCGSQDPRYAYYLVSEELMEEVLCADEFHEFDAEPIPDEGESSRQYSPVQLILLALAGLAIFAFFTWCGYEMAVR